MLTRKRGFNQVDWAISLGIFLIYVAWFFVIVKPQVMDTGVFSPNSEGLKDTFFNITKKTITKIPVFISSDNTIPEQLLEIDVDFLENENYGFVSDSPYLIKDDIIYLIDGASSSPKIYYIVESDNLAYDQSDYRDEGIDSTNSSVNPNSNITLYFNESIESIYFREEKRVDSINYYQNGNPLENINFTFENIFLFGNFDNVFDTFSVSDKLTVGSDIISSRIKKIGKINDINLSIEYSLLNYTDYYIDNLNYGELDDIDGECVVEEGKKLKLTDNESGIYFVFSKEVDITLCNIDVVSVSFNFTNQNIKYLLGFGDSNLTDIPESSEDYDIEFGINIKNEYPLLSRIENLTEDDFSSHKLSGINGFRLSVYNTTSAETDTRNDNILARVWSGNNITSNVYSNDEIITVQDDYGNPRRMTLNVLVW